MDVGDKVNDEQSAFETWARFECGMSGGALSKTASGGYHWGRTADMWATWQAARRTPSASIGEDGLPELPAPKLAAGMGYQRDYYTADQMRQYANEAVAADRRAQGGAGSGVKTWQERVTDNTPAHEYPDAMRAEIADLRAQLARQSRGEAVGVIVGNDPVHGWHMKALKPWDEIGAGTKLYAAPPLSSETQGDA